MAAKKRSEGRVKSVHAAPPASGKLPPRNVCPDKLDIRDRLYLPAVTRAPAPRLLSPSLPDVKDQEETEACTGFALAMVVEWLLARAKWPDDGAISGFMLYSMARRYDEFPGAVALDTGSTLRAALKGWFKHGACRDALWTTKLKMPPATLDPKKDWWLDAAKRPLGAYYRVDTRSVTDMQVALNEVGVLYASAVTHAGWQNGMGVSPISKRKPTIKLENIWQIPWHPGQAQEEGHAFAIVGYNEDGFILQNSWGTTWGSQGRALLSYGDWLASAMDCWVVQLGVLTREHIEVASASTLRVDKTTQRVVLAGDDALRVREISPFIVNTGNDGVLSSSGNYRTSEDDLRALVQLHLPKARERWGLAGNAPIDVALYAHGGLVDEDNAAQTAAKWIPLLYDHHVFPVFFMWETGLVETFVDMIKDATHGQPSGPVGGGIFDHVKTWWDQRLERALAAPGTAVWGEMKQNAVALSGNQNSGPRKLYNFFQAANLQFPIRLHLIGHSAGAIVHSYLIDVLAAQGQKFASVSFMAPAVRIDTFDQHVAPHLLSGTVAKYRQFELTDAAEQNDSSCGLYRRSLLYLVSESFEGGKQTPILGMQHYADDHFATQNFPNTTVTLAPSADSGATQHGAFDDDPTTMNSVITFLTRAG